jgi:glucose/mannose-6-phosphate isomerase
MRGKYAKLMELREALDNGNMLDLVTSFPAHMLDAWERGRAFSAPLSRVECSQIVVCGMGGSAIGGDMVRSYLGDGLGLPIHVNRGYDVPRSLIRNAFFVFSSYSGNTAETLAAFEQVVRAGARGVAITSGGRLELACREHNIPVCKIPGGMPPRSAIAYSFFPLLHVLRALGVSELDEGEFAEVHRQLEGLCNRFTSITSENRAAEIAFSLKGKLPFVYSGGGLYEAVARRWSCQINENGKSLAHYGTFPELNHNEIVGWNALKTLRARIVVVYLQDPDDSAMTTRQADIALELVEPLCSGVIRVSDVPGGRLQRILSVMLLGDFTSVYLGYLNGVDPTPVSNIDFLKNRLGKNHSR